MCFQVKAIVVQELYKFKVHHKLKVASLFHTFKFGVALTSSWVKLKERLVGRASISLKIILVQLVCFKLEASHLGS